MKYLKYFTKESDYQNYINGDSILRPNVSLVTETNSIGFHPQPKETFKMVDLGLPSGLLWADRNIGAASPEDAGLYFSWGDTVGYTADQIPTNKMFRFEDYWDSDLSGTEIAFNKYGKDKITKLELVDDTANVLMGSKYRMPTKADFEELILRTACSFIDISNNRKAVKFASKSNSNYIIIPASEAFFGTLGSSNRTNAGNVWISELLPGYDSARCLDFKYSSTMNIHANKTRFSGIPVRGVCSK